MNKKILILLLFVALLIVSTGCGRVAMQSESEPISVPILPDAEIESEVLQDNTIPQPPALPED